MKTYLFYIYRDTFLPGGDFGEGPDVRRVMCEDPEDWARAKCKGNISKIEWDDISEEPLVQDPPKSGALR